MSSSAISLLGGVLVGFSAIAAPAPDTSKTDFGSPERFSSYDDNYVLWHSMRDDGWVESHEKPLRAHYSIRYLFSNNGVRELFFSYTGEFDFYWFNARPSSPVINRISNPGLHVRMPAERLLPQAGPEDHFELGLEHRSDGQVVEVTSAENAQTAQQAYDDRDRPYFDQISRGSNYFSLKTSLSPKATGLPFYLAVKAKIYCSQNSEVTWGPRAGLHERIAGYDILSLRLTQKSDRLGWFECQWTLGEKGLKTDSLELSWQMPEFEKYKRYSFPLYVRWHRGPMNTLSNYTQRQDSIGVGLRFSCF